MKKHAPVIRIALISAAFLIAPSYLIAQSSKSGPTYPPVLRGGGRVSTETSAEFLKPLATLRKGVSIAKTPPTIDFLYFPGQTYAGNPWSNWGDSLAVNGKYYATIGDHLAPAGNAYVYEYDPAKKTFRKLLDLKKLLKLPEGHYAPGKIHSRLELGSDGRLYCSTHRGSTRVTTDEYHYQGDWIVRVDLKSGRSEVVVHAPIAKHCLPTGHLDEKRLIFYGSTAPGDRNSKDVRFFAYDVQAKKLLCDVKDGPTRAMIVAESTWRVYYTRGSDDRLMRYDPKVGGEPVEIMGKIGIRAASKETAQGIVYTVSQGQGGAESHLYAFHTKSESIDDLGPAAVGTQEYITTLDVDPSGRYIYYMPGAHGGADRDGSPIVQFDTRTKSRKVLAFLHPYYLEHQGCAVKGTYSAALSETGDTLYVNWNANRGSKAWDTCVLTVIHIPESERTP